jgi:hypothetical protein
MTWNVTTHSQPLEPARFQRDRGFGFQPNGVIIKQVKLGSNFWCNLGFSFDAKKHNLYVKCQCRSILFQLITFDVIDLYLERWSAHSAGSHIQGHAGSEQLVGLYGGFTGQCLLTLARDRGRWHETLQPTVSRWNLHASSVTVDLASSRMERSSNKSNSAAIFGAI